MQTLPTYPHIPALGKRETSRAAAETLKNPNSLRALALKAIQTAEQGLTADEIASYLRVSKLSIRPRITELNRLHEIFDSGIRRKNSSGKKAIVWLAV
tara:strand:+ start:1997 stop:2290 length:294 start_codon:yes stop_codon:yes gene_type:complete